MLAAAACAEPQPPNLLLVVVDTLRADRVGVYGAERPTTPRIDRLAREGVWFRRAYSHSGWTLPSVASLLTGHLPHEHRVGRDPRRPTEFGSLAEGVETLPGRLAGAGYATGAVVNNTFLAPAFGLHRGFASYDYRGATRDEWRSAEASVEAALEWVGARREPWFLFLHLMEPHLSYDPPPPVRGTFTGPGPPPIEVPFASEETVSSLYDGPAALGEEGLAYLRALYDEEVLVADRAVGRLVDGLAARGLLDRTVLVVTADHGEEFFDHGSFEHGHTLYGELTRVPLVARGPGVGRGPRDALVAHRDLFAGLLALAGLEPPDPEALDLFALGPRDTGRRHVVSENTLYGPPRVSLVDGDLRLHVDLASGAAEAWRLDAEGLERERLVGEERAREVRRLRASLEAVRGHLRPVSAVDGPHVPDRETFRQLQSLGYVEPRGDG